MTRQDAFQMFLLSAFWGISFLLIKWIGEDFSPTQVAFMRSALGALVLGVALKLGGHALPPLKLWKTLLVVALFNNALPWAFIAWGEQTVSSNIASILNASTPLFTLLLALVVHDATVHRWTIAGVLLGLVGVAFTSFGGVAGGHASTAGIVVLLLSGLGYAIGSTIVKKKLVGLNPVGLALTQLALASLMLLPFAAFGPIPEQMTTKAVLSTLVLGVFGSGLAYLLYYGLMERISPTQVVAVTYVIPIWGLFWGTLVGEHVGWLSLVGVAVIMVGMFLLNQQKPKEKIS